MAMTVMASSRILSSDPSSVNSSNAWKDQMNTRRRLNEGSGPADPSLTDDAPPGNNDAAAGNEDAVDAVDAGDDTDGDDADKGMKTPDDDDNRDTVGSGDDASDGKSKNPIIDQEIVDNAQETPANPSSSPSNQDPCQVAKTCDKCQTKAAELFDKQAENTCAYVKGEDDLIYCQTVKKSTITDPDMNQCSEPKTEDKKPTSTPVPAPIPSNQNMVVSDDAESPIGAILGFILLLTCGCAGFKLRRNVKAQLTATLGAGAGSAVKTTKYHEL